MRMPRPLANPSGRTVFSEADIAVNEGFRNGNVQVSLQSGKSPVTGNCTQEAHSSTV